MKDNSRFDQREPEVVGSQINISGELSGPILSGEFDRYINMQGRTLYPIPCQIPLPPPDFKDRNKELEHILEELDRGASIIAIRGMGGVGKTALGLVLAEKLKGRFPDGQIFLDLQGTSTRSLSTEEAMSQVIRSYRGPDIKLPEDSNSLRGLYHSVLSRKRTLILLDNAASREQVEALLPPSGCVVLITSRQKFFMPGMKAIDLDVLFPHDAHELLIENAVRIGRHADELAELCGYLPLALRNAARALAENIDLGVGEYIKRLKDAKKRLDLLEASLSLEYDMLPLDVQKRWCLLSVFPTDFDREGAATIWKMEPEPTAEALSELVKWSLVEFHPSSLSFDIFSEGRYSLHQLARIFADSHLDPDARIAALHSHAEYYKKVLSDANKLYLDGRQKSIEGLKLFDREWSNIQAGQAWAKNMMIQISHPDFVTHEEGGIDLDGVMLLSNTYYGVGAEILELRLHPRERITWLDTALSAARQLKDRRSECSHLFNLGLAYWELGETRRALGFYEQSLRIAREISDKRYESNILNNIGSVYANTNDPRRAIKFYQQALEIYLDIVDRRGEGTVLGNLGLAYADLGETQKAIEFYNHQIEIARQIGDRRGEGAVLGNLGLAYADLGEIQKAIEFYNQQIEIARQIGDRRGEGNALGNLGLAYASQGEIHKSIELYLSRLAIARETSDRRGEGNVLGNLGLAHADLGETRKAIEFYEQQMSIVKEINDRRGEGNALGNLGIAYASLGELDKAIECYEQQMAITSEIGDRRGTGNALWNLSITLRQRGDWTQSTSKAGNAYEIFAAIESPTANLVYEWLLKQLAEADVQARKAAIEALTTLVLKDKKVRANILMALKDTSGIVRLAAVKALSSLVSDDEEVRSGILAMLNDSDSAIQEAAASMLGLSASSDETVQRSLLLYWRKIGKGDPTNEVRQFLEAADFDIQLLKDVQSFICVPNTGKWSGRIILNENLYIYCFFGKILDREAVTEIYQISRSVGDFKTIFVFIDQIPSDSGWIEISALRSEGIQVVPIDDTVIQRGREQQKEHRELEGHLSRFLGHGRNLYNVRDPVSDRLNFFGREAYAKEMLEMLFEGKPIALFGLRKMGKSSLLHYMRDKADFPVAYVDLEAGCELSSFFSRILRSWRDSFRIKSPGFDWNPPLLHSDPPGEFSSITHDLIEQLEAKGHSPQLGLFIDEIEWIVPKIQVNSQNYEPDSLDRYLIFARTLRGLVQETKTLGLMIVGVDPRIIRINRLNGEQNPFYQFFKEEYLGPLSRDDCIQMIRNIGRQMDMNFRNEALAFIADVSGRHPYVARQLCSMVVDDLSREESERRQPMRSESAEEISLSCVQSIAERFIRDPATASLLNEGGLWGEVTNPMLWPVPQVQENRAILTTLARVNGQPEGILLSNGIDREARENSVIELKKRTILDWDRLDEMLCIQMRLFKNWISHYQLRDE